MPGKQRTSRSVSRWNETRKPNVLFDVDGSFFTRDRSKIQLTADQRCARMIDRSISNGAFIGQHNTISYSKCYPKR